MPDSKEHTRDINGPASQLELGQGYDIIGDIHGCAYTLEKLLVKMGYEKQDGVYKHQHRKAIFLGDIVDRGPHIREALHLVKNMVDAGYAYCIMGNHEYNAIAYTTAIDMADDDTGEKQFVREHNARNNRQISETLTQFAAYPEEWRTFLDWFLTLPLYLEFDDFRVVHACWDQQLIDALVDLTGGAKATPELVRESFNPNSLAGRIFDRLTRGTGLPLPEGRTIKGSDGYIRRIFRTKFWAHNPTTYKDVVFQPDPLPEDLIDFPLNPDQQASLLSYADDLPPIFVGHYWLQGRPRPIKPNIACLDYSAVKYGRLVAYRFCGEQRLSEDKFEWVYVDP
ncbi:metallophosphoesterase [Saccharophagus degradans]|uniref:metallophosphoesterase n=1 Tax=Saccharophagus degradans TaxID=86304 RepID=UPI00209041CD|nr:metallophosphoesterase [Saccharophagus degradans]WGO96766.1 metallophosphoesterase [Saccharophagus degradans]